MTKKLLIKLAGMTHYAMTKIALSTHLLNNTILYWSKKYSDMFRVEKSTCPLTDPNLDFTITSLQLYRCATCRKTTNSYIWRHWRLCALSFALLQRVWRLYRNRSSLCCHIMIKWKKSTLRLRIKMSRWFFTYFKNLKLNLIKNFVSAIPKTVLIKSIIHLFHASLRVSASRFCVSFLYIAVFDEAVFFTT